MWKRKVALIIITALVSIIAMAVGAYALLQASHLRQTKSRLLALAHDKAATSERVIAIAKHHDERWTDGGIGVTGDGYLFYYHLHNSHGMDLIADTNIFYLPDEHRFIVSRQHFCVDLNKKTQPKSKAELLSLLEAGW